MELDRRQFLTWCGVGGAAALGAGMVGCSSGGNAAATKDKADATEDKAASVSETMTADIVIVGGGMSGLAAAVQAGNNGDKVILLEATGATGGAGNGVEGIFAVNSSMQKKLGIELNPAEVLSDEVASTNYTNSGLHWRNMITASGDNIDWLLEQGAEFSGTVDGYQPGGRFQTFHWWKDGHAKDGYKDQMTSRAEELGVTILVNTAATELIMNDDKVVGLYAEKADGSLLQVDAPAVILAAGGFIGNEELLAEQMYITSGEMADACLETAQTLHRTGDGMNMALAIGAKNYPGTCIEGWFQPEGMPVGDASMTFSVMITDDVMFREAVMYSGLVGGGPVVWVEDHAQRFVNEAQALTEIERTFTTRKFYKNHYQVFDQKFVDTIYAGNDAWGNAFKQILVDYPDSIKQADTIEELAKKLGLDEKALSATMSEYNGYCEAGVDEAFGKPADFLAPIQTPPFYGFRCVICGDATLGGICVDTDFRALDLDKQPIPGLYMAGVDSAMLYNCVYPIGVPGTACCNSINSGRTSANHAHTYVAGA